MAEIRLSEFNPDTTELFWYDMPPRHAATAEYWAATFTDAYGGEKQFMPVRRFHHPVTAVLRGEHSVIAKAHELETVQTVKESLVDRQGRLVSVAFTHSDVDPVVKGEISINPDPGTSRRLDSKFEQYGLFRELGLPVPDFCVAEADCFGRDDLPFYYTAEYSSGGAAAGLVDTPEALAVLREKYADKRVLAAQFLGCRILAPSVAGLAYGNSKADVLAMSDQVLDEDRYVGNALPVSASLEHIHSMEAMTRKIGEAIGSRGFEGVFCNDYFIDTAGELWVTDLNPRRFGAYSLLSRLSAGRLQAEEYAVHRHGTRASSAPLLPEDSKPTVEFGLLVPANERQAGRPVPSMTEMAYNIPAYGNAAARLYFDPQADRLPSNIVGSVRVDVHHPGFSAEDYRKVTAETWNAIYRLQEPRSLASD